MDNYKVGDTFEYLGVNWTVEIVYHRPINIRYLTGWRISAGGTITINVPTSEVRKIWPDVEVVLPRNHVEALKRAIENIGFGPHSELELTYSALNEALKKDR